MTFNITKEEKLYQKLINYVEKKDVWKVKLLVENGANIHYYGCTPLLISAS
jgi:hypothetical protein